MNKFQKTVLALCIIMAAYFWIIPTFLSIYYSGKIIVHEDGTRQQVQYVIAWPDRHLYVFVVDGGGNLNTEEFYEKHPEKIRSSYEGYVYINEGKIEN